MTRGRAHKVWFTLHTSEAHLPQEALVEKSWGFVLASWRDARNCLPGRAPELPALTPGKFLPTPNSASGALHTQNSLSYFTPTVLFAVSPKTLVSLSYVSCPPRQGPIKLEKAKSRHPLALQLTVLRLRVLAGSPACFFKAS
jgi:hypothetical protein